MNGRCTLIKKLRFYDNDFITLHKPNIYIYVSITPTLHIQRISTKLFVVMSVARYLPCEDSRKFYNDSVACRWTKSKDFHDYFQKYIIIAITENIFL